MYIKFICCMYIKFTTSSLIANFLLKIMCLLNTEKIFLSPDELTIYDEWR